MFALKRTSLGSVLDCVAPCLEESLLSLAKLRLEEVCCNSRSDENFISKKKNLKNLPFKKRDAFFKLAVVTIVFR